MQLAPGTQCALRDHGEVPSRTAGVTVLAGMSRVDNTTTSLPGQHSECSYTQAPIILKPQSFEK